LQASGAAIAPANLDYQAEIVELAQITGLQGAHRMVAGLENTIQMLDQYINTRLALEVLMLDLPRV